MPKELIHFTVAEETARRLSNTWYAPHLQDNQTGLLFGSILHDVLFYATRKRDSALEELAHVLHGANGQDTFTLLSLQVEHIKASTSPGLPIALLAGMVSHLFADVVMHPMVWHLSGDYYEQDEHKRSLARQRHRALESLMDMVACPERIAEPRYKVRNVTLYLKGRLFEALPIEGLADLAAVDADEALKGMQRAISLQSKIQRCCTFPPLARLLYRLRPVLPDSAKEIVALFYSPQLLQQAAPLCGPIAYQHPVTGEHHAATLNQLISQAADQSVAMLKTLEPAVFTGAPLTFDGNGPSLDAGIAQTPTTSMHHFADPPFPDLT